MNCRGKHCTVAHSSVPLPLRAPSIGTKPVATCTQRPQWSRHMKGCDCPRTEPAGRLSPACCASWAAGSPSRAAFATAHPARSRWRGVGAAAGQGAPQTRVDPLAGLEEVLDLIPQLRNPRRWEAAQLRALSVNIVSVKAYMAMEASRGSSASLRRLSGLTTKLRTVVITRTVSRNSCNGLVVPRTGSVTVKWEENLLFPDVETSCYPGSPC